MRPQIIPIDTCDQHAMPGYNESTSTDPNSTIIVDYSDRDSLPSWGVRKPRSVSSREPRRFIAFQPWYNRASESEASSSGGSGSQQAEENKSTPSTMEEEAFHERPSYESPKMSALASPLITECRWKRLYKEQMKADEEAVIQRCQRRYDDEVQNAMRELDVADEAQTALHDAATSAHPQASKLEATPRKQVHFALEQTTGESSQDPKSSATEATIQKPRMAAVKAGEQITRILRLEEQLAGKQLSNEPVRNAKREQAEASQSTRHPATAANPKPWKL